MTNAKASDPTSTVDNKQSLISNLNNPDYYINREISHLQFNIRILEQARNEDIPLLERLHFLMIFSRNMDEFFEIRVSGIKQQIEFAREIVYLDGMQPKEILAEISTLAHEYVDKQYSYLNEVMLPELEKEGIQFLRRSQLNEKQRSWVKTFFYQQVMPIISPIGLDPAHPFPRLANKILNFIVELDGKDAFGRETGMAIIPAPRSLPRVIKIIDRLNDSDGEQYLLLSSIIHEHAADLFPGMVIKGCYQFRITRNSDLSLDDDADDLASALQGELLSRRYGEAVRLEVADNCPKHLSLFLLKQCSLTESELYEVKGPVNLTRLTDVINLASHRHLHFKSFSPSIPKVLQKNVDRLFDTIQEEDLLLLHPFQSFTPIVDLLRLAAKDPHVLAIKQTLYRTEVKSEMVNALAEAARHGKEVTVVVEIRARFDEEENLLLARRLQEAGAIIVYGVVGYKTHTKLMLIVRREGKKIVRYAHLGTGNYHVNNARLYTDYSLITCKDDLTNDVHKVFQQITGMGKAVRVKKIFHAPFTLKKNLLDLINVETQNAKAGHVSHIIFKVNAITDPDVIKVIYKASQAGVKVDLIIRGICSLRPGIVGLSDNICVYSIVGRFLEHSRVYYFLNNNVPKVYCSSADLMVRNLDHRIEACFPIENANLAIRIRKELDLYLNDNTGSWMLKADGSYEKRTPGKNQKNRNAQQTLLKTLVT